MRFHLALAAQNDVVDTAAFSTSTFLPTKLILEFGRSDLTSLFSSREQAFGQSFGSATPLPGTASSIFLPDNFSVPNCRGSFPLQEKTSSRTATSAASLATPRTLFVAFSSHLILIMAAGVRRMDRSLQRDAQSRAPSLAVGRPGGHPHSWTSPRPAPFDRRE